MRRSPYTQAAAFLLSVALSLATTAQATTVGEIAKNPTAFDQKTVTVTGTAREMSSRIDVPFKLCLDESCRDLKGDLARARP